MYSLVKNNLPNGWVRMWHNLVSRNLFERYFEISKRTNPTLVWGIRNQTVYMRFWMRVYTLHGYSNQNVMSTPFLYISFHIAIKKSDLYFIISNMFKQGITNQLQTVLPWRPCPKKHSIVYLQYACKIDSTSTYSNLIKSLPWYKTAERQHHIIYTQENKIQTLGFNISKHK